MKGQGNEAQGFDPKLFAIAQSSQSIVVILGGEEYSRNRLFTDFLSSYLVTYMASEKDQYKLDQLVDSIVRDFKNQKCELRSEDGKIVNIDDDSSGMETLIRIFKETLWQLARSPSNSYGTSLIQDESGNKAYVIYGKGNFDYNDKNREYRRLINEYSEIFTIVSKHEKVKIIDQILNQIGHFGDLEGDILSDKKSREKIRRDLTRRKKVTKQLNQTP